MNEIENDFDKMCCPNLEFQCNNRFQEDQADFWTRKFTLKTENIKFLTTLPRVVLQDTKYLLGGLIWLQKTIEINLPQYKIPQLSPRQHTYLGK